MSTKRLDGSRLVGLVVTVAAAAFAILVFTPFSLPWSHGLHLSLQAGAYGQLNPGAWVELSGARVGSVDRVEYQDGYALIRVSIDPRYAGQLHADTSAAIRPHGLLGPKYVYLNGGSTGQLHDGASIPLSRTSVSTDFDQVLNSLQPDIRANLKTIFVELGRAADGRQAREVLGQEHRQREAVRPPDKECPARARFPRRADLACTFPRILEPAVTNPRPL